MRYSQHNPGAIRHISNAIASGVCVARALMMALDSLAEPRRGSKVESARKNPNSRSTIVVDTISDKLMRALLPGSGALPHTPHPAYDVNHFNLRGYVSGDRLGPDFVMVGRDMGPGEKMVTFWLWECRVVGAYVSNPTDKDKSLLDEATREQWYIENLPELRDMTNAYEALEHIKHHHRR